MTVTRTQDLWDFFCTSLCCLPNTWMRFFSNSDHTISTPRQFHSGKIEKHRKILHLRQKKNILVTMQVLVLKVTVQNADSWCVAGLHVPRDARQLWSPDGAVREHDTYSIAEVHIQPYRHVHVCRYTERYIHMPIHRHTQMHGYTDICSCT